MSGLFPFITLHSMATRSDCNFSGMMGSPPSIPLQLCGFLEGDTVQVRGDTGELQFSVQFSVSGFDFASASTGDIRNSVEEGLAPTENIRDSVNEESVPPPTSLTPTASARKNQDENAEVGESPPAIGSVQTRLRTGTLTPMKYFPDRLHSASNSCSRSVNRTKANGKRDRTAMDKMLRRRSFPIRPCTAYAFFLMANWTAVKHTSFVEISRKLSQKWHKLPQHLKKEYEDMAIRDHMRYKRQCVLLRNDIDSEQAEI